jgi:hypothetical protein
VGEALDPLVKQDRLRPVSTDCSNNIIVTWEVGRVQLADCCLSVLQDQGSNLGGSKKNKIFFPFVCPSKHNLMRLSYSAFDWIQYSQHESRCSRSICTLFFVPSFE